MSKPSERPGFLLYLEELTALSMLPDEELVEVMRAIADYVLDGEKPEWINERSKATRSKRRIFQTIVGKINRDGEKYDRKIEQRRKAGKISAEKRKKQANELIKSKPEATKAVLKEEWGEELALQIAPEKLTPYSLDDIRAAARKAKENAIENPPAYLLTTLEQWRKDGRPHKIAEPMLRHRPEERAYAKPIDFDADEDELGLHK